MTTAGNVGIGTTSPSYKLVVNSGTDGVSAGIAGSTYGIRFDNGGTFSSGMSTIHGVDSTLTGSYQPIMLNGSDVRFGISGTERMRITSAGNVGIGTSVISQNFAGYTHLDIGNATTGGILLFSNASGTNYGYVNADAGGINIRGTVGNVYFNTGATERMRITSGGNVGIGTTTISTNSLIRELVIGQSITNGVSQLSFRSDSNSLLSSISLSSYLAENLFAINAQSSIPIVFFTNSTERMRITSAGNVGIGTTAPTTYSLAGRHLELNDAGGGYSFIHCNTTSVKSFYAANESAGLAALFTFSNHALTFGTNNAERMRITSGGNVLIGKTSDNGYKLQVLGSISATSFFETSDLRLKNITKKYDSEEFGAIEFGWIDGRDSKNHWGYVAQEVQKYLPDAIHLGNDGFLAVDYNQAHTFKIAKVEDEVTILKKRVSELEAQLNSL